MLILALFSFFPVGVADRESSDGSPFANHCSLEHARDSLTFRYILRIEMWYIVLDCERVNLQ